VRIISRYLLVQFAVSSATVLLGIVAIWLAADSLLNIDEFASEPGAVLWGLALHGLELVPLAVPLSAVVGATWSVTRAARHREITAIQSGGVPLRTALLPIAVACVVAAAALVWLEDRVLVPTRARAIEARQFAESGGRGRPTWANGRYWYATGASVLSAAEWIPERSTLVDVTIFELDPALGIRRRIDAREAHYVADSTWDIADARVIDFTLPALAPEHMVSLRADLGIGSAEFTRSAPPLQTLTLRRLAQRGRRESDAHRRASYGVAFHARIAQPLSILVLVLFALRFAIRDTERGDSLARALLWSLGVTAVFWVCFTLALFAGRSAVVAAPVPIWLVLAAFLAAGVSRFRAIEE
jgi:lipopolysaccharide export LptBFGC system permease protein LptF